MHNRPLGCFVAISLLASCSTTLERSVAQPPDPSKFSFARIYCTPDNESHFDAVTQDLAKVDAAPPAMPFYAKASAATRVAFAAFEPGWGVQDEKAKLYHPAPAAQYVIYLGGQMTIIASDGQSRQFGVGDVLPGVSFAGNNWRSQQIWPRGLTSASDRLGRRLASACVNSASVATALGKR